MVKFMESSITNGVVTAQVRYSAEVRGGKDTVIIHADTFEDGVNLGDCLPWYYENKTDHVAGKRDFGRAIIEPWSDYFYPARERCPS